MPSAERLAVRSLVFHVPIDSLPPALRALLPQYRLMLNRPLRAALTLGVTSRAGFNRVAYRDLAAQHNGLSSYVVQAITDALGILRAHRRRVRRGNKSRTPFVKCLFMKVAPRSFHFDPKSGNLRVSVGNGAWVMFALPVSQWHRTQLEDTRADQILLTIKPGKVVLTVSLTAPAPYPPEAILAMDTNEQSFDGVLAAGERATMARVSFGEIRSVQARHFVRRRRMAAKKAHDRRVQHRLIAGEGRRERNRVKARLHLVSKGLVRAAKDGKAAIVLEDLTGIRQFFTRQLNRRLSIWPHRELHRQIAYKALAAGVPVIFVNPYLTSQKCAACGWTPKRSKTRTSARRADGIYICGNPECKWRINRQFNAGVNILRTALGNHPGLGGVRFHLDALSRDVMNPLCEPAPWAVRGERMERESRTAASAAARTATSAAAGR